MVRIGGWTELGKLPVEWLVNFSCVASDGGCSGTIVGSLSDARFVINAVWDKLGSTGFKDGGVFAGLLVESSATSSDAE